MKIVHAADLHVDSPLRGLERYEGAPVERVRSATRDAFGRVIDVCLSEGARYLVLAGDVFDEDWKDVNTGVFFVKQLARLRAIGCRVLLLRGNHDFELTRALRWPDFVHEFAGPRSGKGSRSREGRENSYVFEHDGVAFHGVSYPEREVRTSLLPDYPAPLDGLLNVGVLHTNATGSAEHKAYAPCSVRELAEKGYGYWALGHVHRHAVLAKDPWIVYPGNTQGRHANEPGPKGCVVLETDGASVASLEVAETSVMRWWREEIELGREDDVDELHERVRARLDAILEESDGRLAAVRVVVRGGCRAHAAICRDPRKIVAQIRVDAIDRGADLWIEKVRLETSPEASIEQLRDAQGLVADLLRNVDAIRRDEGDAELLHVARVLEPVRKKLAKELDEVGLDLSSPDVLRELLGQAEALLAQRLTEGEG